MADVGAGRKIRRAAADRARALADGDADALRALLHPGFVWTSHRGDRFDREAYLAANVGGPTVWHSQTVDDVTVTVVGDSAVLCCTVTDEVTTRDGRGTFRMPMTQTWVNVDGRWQCLAGHAGPRIPS